MSDCCISVAVVILLTVFGYSAYKLTDELLKAKEEKDAFSALSSIVANSVTSPVMPDQQSRVAVVNNDPTESPSVISDVSSALMPSEYPAFDSTGLPLASDAQGGTSPIGTEAAEPFLFSAEPSSVHTDPEGQNEQIPLSKYLPLFEMNPEFFGWLSIDGTGIDYPIMYSPDRPEYYINHSFDGSNSSSGVPFIDERCDADGNCFLIYGHHMRNKTMFGQLPKYADQSYYEEHSVINFDTLYEQREYRVIAAFFSRAYGKKETGVFRYYEYTDLSDEETFNEYMEQVYAAAIYDTGIKATYGEELLVLSTCNYHTDNGRFVVVAKRIK